MTTSVFFINSVEAWKRVRKGQKLLKGKRSCLLIPLFCKLCDVSSEVDAPPELNCKSRAAKTFLKGIWLGHRAELEGIEVLYWRLSCHKNGFLQKFEIRAISLICWLMKLFQLTSQFYNNFCLVGQFLGPRSRELNLQPISPYLFLKRSFWWNISCNFIEV